LEIEERKGRKGLPEALFSPVEEKELLRKAEKPETGFVSVQPGSCRESKGGAIHWIFAKNKSKRA